MLVHHSTFGFSRSTLTHQSFAVLNTPTARTCNIVTLPSNDLILVHEFWLGCQITAPLAALPDANDRISLEAVDAAGTVLPLFVIPLKFDDIWTPSPTVPNYVLFSRDYLPGPLLINGYCKLRLSMSLGVVETASSSFVTSGFVRYEHGSFLAEVPAAGFAIPPMVV